MALKWFSMKLPLLKTLTLAESSITDDAILSLISGLTRVQKLNIWGCTNLSSAAIQLMEKYLPDLTALELSFCTQLDDNCLLRLNDYCPKVQTLCLWNVGDLTERSITRLGSTSLQNLNLKNCCIIVSNDTLKTVLERSPSLNTLNLTNNGRIDDSGLSYFSSSHLHIKSLNLTGLFKVTDEGISSLLSCKELVQSLESLTLESCLGITDISVERVLQTCTALDNLSLNWNAQLSDNAFTALRRPLGLRNLGLAGLERLTDATFVRLMKFCRRLKTFDMPWIKELGEISFLEVLRNCPNLHSWNVAYDAKITDDVICQLFERCVNLKRLDISACTNLTDVTLRACKTNARTLLHLDISWCPAFSESAILSLTKHSPTLQSVKLRRNPGSTFSEGFIRYLRETCTHLNIMDT